MTGATSWPVRAVGRAIAPDMPGYGRAGKPKHFRYSVDG